MRTRYLLQHLNFYIRDKETWTYRYTDFKSLRKWTLTHALQKDGDVS